VTIEIRSGYIPASKRLIENPTAEQLRELTARMPNARRTSFDNYNVHTRVDSRSTKNTYIVTDRPEEHTAQTVTPEEGRKWAKLQDEYIREQEMVLLDGIIGNDPSFLTPARLIIEAGNANIAGMQRHLYYRPAGGQQPRPYDFRHHFAYACIERWAREGKDVNAMLPYLSRYMGHASFDSTYYYIHTSPDFMDAYAQITQDSQALLPEVGFG